MSMYRTPILFTGKERQNFIADIEDMAEKGPTCVKLIVDEFGISESQATAFIGKLVKSGAFIKCKDKMRIGGEPRTMYQLAELAPKQVKLIDPEPARRDWLQIAFFGEAK